MNNKVFITATLGCITLFAQAQKRPNVIIILADDLGYGDVSAQGSTTIKTPNFDRLANGGVRFTKGYSTSATSTPSRYALMTGMYPWKNPNSKILAGDAPLIIKEDQATLPRMMQNAGYKTAAIGKWHLGMGTGTLDWNKTFQPGAKEIGFDYSNIIAATNDRVPTVYVENGDVVNRDPKDPILVDYTTNFEGEPTGVLNPELLKMKWSRNHNNAIVNGISRLGFMKGGEKARWVDEEMADYFLNLAKKFVDENKAKPFLLYYGLHEPHVPRAPNSRFAGTSGMGPRGDAILEADWCVGQLLDYLEKNQLLENTLIIFSSDNGPVLDDGYQDQSVELLGNHKPSGGFRGGKYSLFEAGTRIPFFCYWKGTIQPAVSDAMVCQLDLMASIASLLKIKVPNGLDSEDYLSAFLGKSKTARKELVIEAGGRIAYRTTDYVLIPAYPDKTSKKTIRENGMMTEVGLFNLNTDKGQLENIAPKKPEIVAEMTQRMNILTKDNVLTNDILLKKRE